MNLYLRLLMRYAFARFGAKGDLLRSFTTTHIVWPNDLDLLGHMNNGRYFTVTDIARAQLLFTAGAYRDLRKRGLMPLLGGETAQFRKPLLPFRRYQITTELLGWDKKFFYIEHRFVRRNELHALILVKVCIGGAAKPSPAQVMRLWHDNIANERVTPMIRQWNEASATHYDLAA